MKSSKVVLAALAYACAASFSSAFAQTAASDAMAGMDMSATSGDHADSASTKAFQAADRSMMSGMSGVEYTGDADAARGAAMQIAAMRPQYLTRDEVPADVVEHERQIAEATSREEGKPEQAIAKITEGRLNGFFKEVVLLEQPSVTENKKSVQKVLDEAGTTLKRFARFEVGA